MSPSEPGPSIGTVPANETGSPELLGEEMAREQEGPVRAQDAVLALGRRAVATPDSEVLIHDAARLIAEIAGTELALIAAREDGPRQRLLKLADESSSPPADESSENGHLADLAVDRAHPIVVPDLLHSDVYSDPYLEANNIRGALIVPLRLQKEAFGALGACSEQRIDFEVDAIYVAETIAHVVATTLAHYRSESLLQQSRLLNETLYDTIDALVLVVDASGRVENMNRACTEVTGFSPEDFMGRPMWSVLAPPSEIGTYRGAIDRLATSGPPVALEASLLTKHAQRRIIAWRCGASPDSEKGETSFLLTGIDVTEQRLAEERAERARKALAHLRGESTPPDEAVAQENDHYSASVSGRSGELASGRRPTSEERRLKPRRPFPYRQNIAYITGDTYPEEDEFFEVRCRDIAAGGFSFVTPVPPRERKLVVALGSPRHLTYLIARVVHVTQIVEREQLVHVVGCQYTGRAPR